MKVLWLMDGKRVPVWELARLTPSRPDIPCLKTRGKPGSDRSKAAEKAWETMRRRYGPSGRRVLK